MDFGLAQLFQQYEQQMREAKIARLRQLWGYPPVGAGSMPQGNPRDLTALYQDRLPMSAENHMRIQQPLLMHMYGQAHLDEQLEDKPFLKGLNQPYKGSI